MTFDIDITDRALVTKRFVSYCQIKEEQGTATLAVHFTVKAV